MSVGEGAISFDNQEVQTQSTGNFSDKPTRRLKMETGHTYRIKFTSETVEMRKRHFNPKDKRYYRCLEHQGYCPICVAATNKVGEGKEAIKRASETFGANILVYDTDDQGELKQPLNAEVYFWAFGSDKFVAIRSIKKDWGSLLERDLKVECTDGQFQKCSITPLPKCEYMDDANFKAACDKKIKEDSYPLDKFLCKEVPLLDLVKAFKLPINEYIPAEILSQITGNQPIAQDMAKQTQSIPSEVTQDLPFDSGSSTSQTTQAPPEPPADNFANLDDLQALL